MSRGGDLFRTFLRGTGQTLITLGLVVLLFCVYELKITNLVTARAQDRLGDELRRTWAEPPPPATAEPGEPVVADPAVEIGDAYAVLHVPGLDGWDPKVVVEGVSTEDLKNGPGHIPETADPGELGNLVLSGHRTTYGAPFERFDELSPGDVVVVETRDGWFTYTMTGAEIVAPTAVEVTYAVPGDPTATPTERLLTLTTCHPKYSAQSRLILRGELTAASDKSAGPPAALAVA